MAMVLIDARVCDGFLPSIKRALASSPEDILLSKASRMIDAEAHGEVRLRLVHAYVYVL